MLLVTGGSSGRRRRNGAPPIPSDQDVRFRTSGLPTWHSAGACMRTAWRPGVNQFTPAKRISRCFLGKYCTATIPCALNRDRFASMVRSPHAVLEWRRDSCHGRV